MQALVDSLHIQKHPGLIAQIQELAHTIAKENQPAEGRLLHLRKTAVAAELATPLLSAEQLAQTQYSALVGEGTYVQRLGPKASHMRIGIPSEDTIEHADFIPVATIQADGAGPGGVRNVHMRTRHGGVQSVTELPLKPDPKRSHQVLGRYYLCKAPGVSVTPQMRADFANQGIALPEETSPESARRINHVIPISVNPEFEHMMHDVQAIVEVYASGGEYFIAITDARCDFPGQKKSSTASSSLTMTYGDFVPGLHINIEADKMRLSLRPEEVQKEIR